MCVLIVCVCVCVLREGVCVCVERERERVCVLSSLAGGLPNTSSAILALHLCMLLCVVCVCVCACVCTYNVVDLHFRVRLVAYCQLIPHLFLSCLCSILLVFALPSPPYTLNTRAYIHTHTLSHSHNFSNTLTKRQRERKRRPS